ncbi:MAG TPA: hypothetical protein VK689_23670, partial [Armatimonadota bacterium]|nr:hypothetical protein [Armatimonadota bacterium]
LAAEGAADVKAQLLRPSEKRQGPASSPSAFRMAEPVDQWNRDARREQLRRYPEIIRLLRRHGARQ